MPVLLIPRIAGSHRFQFRISLDGFTSGIDNIHFKTGEGVPKARLFPRFDRDVTVSSPMIVILRQAFAIAAYISSGEVKYAHAEPLNALNLPLDVGYARHLSVVTKASESR